MAKLRIYVHSLELSTADLFDKDSFLSFHNAEAADAMFRPTSFRSAQKTFGDRLERTLNLLQNRYLIDEEREALSRVESFCTGNAIEFEVVDVGTLSFLKKVKGRILGLKTPTVVCWKRILLGVPSETELKKLVSIM